MKKSNTSTVVLLVVAVLAGIWLYRRLQASGKVSVPAKNDPTAGRFEGPDIDSRTGDWLPAGNRPGTVDYSTENR